MHQFQLLTQGAALATLDGGQIEMRAPAALMVAPGVVHGFVYERQSAGQQVTVPTASLRAGLGTALTLDAQLGLCIHVAASSSNIGSEGGDLDQCEALFGLLAREFAQSRRDRAEALNAHALLLALWFLRHEADDRSGAHHQALRDTLVRRYRALLEQHFRQQRPVQFYAQALGITADHLSRSCRATTGEGALDLMHARVVLEARRLLAHTPGPVTQVARELGFEDPGHFSRFFSKAVGQPPSAYRDAVALGLATAPGSPKILLEEQSAIF